MNIIVEETKGELESAKFRALQQPPQTLNEAAREEFAEGTVQKDAQPLFAIDEGYNYP